MGQYYTAVLKSRNGRLKGYELGGSYKLMEHSWFGNYLVNAVCNDLMDKVYRIGWVGDYADQEDFNYDKKMVDFMNGNIKNLNIKNVNGERYEFDPTDKVLLNHTKKQKIHLGEYYQNSKYEDWGQDWCIHPLPLLTAIGNGKGGGDYFGEYQDKVGQWANDKLSIVLEQEDNFDYEVLEVYFEEAR